ncbi:MAG TPA: hypothetical protein V6D08_01465 [Candidatus Obscuribacterales bacterium]
MSKQGRHEARFAFRGDSHGERNSRQGGEHAEAGDRLRSAAYGQFQRVDHEQPRAGGDGSNGSKAQDGSPRGAFPGDRQRTTGSDRATQDAGPVRSATRQGAGDTSASVLLLDRRHSVAQLVEKGVLKRSATATADTTAQDKAALAARPEGKPDAGDRVKEGEQRTQPIDKVKVVYADRSNDPAARVNKPDFIVKKDGSVEVVNDPEKNNRKEVVIQVERDQGEVTGPTEAQRRSTDELVGYVSDRLMRTKNDGTRDGVIEDQQGLVSESVKGRLKTRPVPEDTLPVPARRQVENMRRFSGGGRGTLSPEQADSYFTPRDQAPPRRPDETSQQWSLKETVAGMLSHGEVQPYESVRHTGERGWAVGRYQLTYDLISQWLTDLMGDPPDPAKLDEAVRKGKISPAMAAKLKSPQFRQFLDKLKSAEQPSTADVKEFLPRELQETIGGDLVNKFAAQCRTADGRVDAGMVALSMAVGHVPTEADLAKPEFQAFVDAGRRLGSISDARTENPGQPLEWQEVNQRLLVAAKQSVGKPMWATGPWNHASLEYGNLGCAASVSQVIKAAGIDGPSSAGASALGEKILKAGGQRVTNPQPGDIVVGRRGPGKHGHIGIVGEDGKVYHNSSAKRYWVEGDLAKVFSAQRGFVDVYYVRLPQNA